MGDTLVGIRAQNPKRRGRPWPAQQKSAPTEARKEDEEGATNEEAPCGRSEDPSTSVAVASVNVDGASGFLPYKKRHKLQAENKTPTFAIPTFANPPKAPANAMHSLEATPARPSAAAGSSSMSQYVFKGRGSDDGDGGFITPSHGKKRGSASSATPSHSSTQDTAFEMFGGEDPSLRSSDALGPEDDEDDEDEWEAADERRRRAKATTVGQDLQSHMSDYFPSYTTWAAQQPPTSDASTTLFCILRHLAWIKTDKASRGKPPRLPTELANTLGDRAIRLIEFSEEARKNAIEWALARRGDGSKKVLWILSASDAQKLYKAVGVRAKMVGQQYAVYAPRLITDNPPRNERDADPDAGNTAQQGSIAHEIEELSSDEEEEDGPQQPREDFTALYLATRPQATALTDNEKAALLKKRMAALDEVWSIARYQLGQPADLLDEDGQPRVVCVYRGFDITRPLMLCLQKNKQLTDEIVNCFFEMINGREASRAKADGVRKGCFVMKTVFYRNLAGVHNYAKGVDLLECDMMLIPVHLPGHWALIVVDVLNKEIKYLDSYKNTDGADHVTNIVRYLQRDHEAKTGEALSMDGWTLTTQQQGLPQQTDTDCCGVFICAFAYLLSERLPLKFKQGEVDRFRLRMVRALVEGGLPL